MWTWWRGRILNQIWGLHKWQDPDKVHDRWNFTQRIFARAGLGPLQCHHYGRSPRTVLKHRRTLWTFKVRRIKTFGPQAYSHLGDHGRWKVCGFFRKYSDFQHTGTNLSCRCSLQVNLCQKLLFLHQLTHNMTTDCSLNYKFNTWKFQAQTWGEHVVYRNHFWHSEQFLYTTCSPHVLQKEELLTKIYLYQFGISFDQFQANMTNFRQLCTNQDPLGSVWTNMNMRWQVRRN